MSRIGKATEKKSRYIHRIYRTLKKIKQLGVLVVIVAFIRLIYRAIKKLEVLGVLLAIAALIITFMQFQEERQVNAWQLLATKTTGNSGKITALQYLNEEKGLICREWLRGRLNWLHDKSPDPALDPACIFRFKKKIPLVGIDLSPPDENSSGVFLNGVDLRYATLEGAIMNSAMLPCAKLQSANMHSAKLRNAYLFSANLDSANLMEADLTCANLEHADLKDAGLTNTILDSANLMDAEGLTQDQLATACGNKETKLPEGLNMNLRPCTDTRYNLTPKCEEPITYSTPKCNTLTED